MVQRLLAARNERDSKKALLVSGVIIFVQFTLFLVIGVMLFVYMRNGGLAVPGGDADRIYPAFIVHRMPVGLAGIVLASIFAIAMSNASGSLNSLASSSMMDMGARRAEMTAQSLGAFAADDFGVGRGAGAAGADSLGASAGGGIDDCFHHLRRVARRVFAGHLESSARMKVARWWDLRPGLAAMIAVNRFTPLAWTWYVLAGTIVTFRGGHDCERIGARVGKGCGRDCGAIRILRSEGETLSGSLHRRANDSI